MRPQIMKAKVLYVLMFGCLSWLSCKTNTASKCGPCPLIAQFAPFINVRIVDKTSGADLFLSPTSPYKLSDLKINSSVDGENINVFVDSIAKDNRFVKILATTTQTFTIKLATLSAGGGRGGRGAGAPGGGPGAGGAGRARN